MHGTSSGYISEPVPVGMTPFTLKKKQKVRVALDGSISCESLARPGPVYFSAGRSCMGPPVARVVEVPNSLT